MLDKYNQARNRYGGLPTPAPAFASMAAPSSSGSYIAPANNDWLITTLAIGGATCVGVGLFVLTPGFVVDDAAAATAVYTAIQGGSLAAQYAR